MKYQDNPNLNLNDNLKGELRYITLAQVIGCVLVIFGHSFPFVTEVPRAVRESQVFLYAFHMPLFVWCSGFLFAYTRQTEKNGLGAFAGKRAVKILVPYVVLSLVGIAPKALFSSVLNDSLSLGAYSLTRAFLVPRENIWGHFWFLPMIYLMGVGAYLLDKIFKKTDKREWWWLIATVGLFAVSEVKSDAGKWLGMNDILHYGWTYVLGVWMGYVGAEWLTELSSKRMALIAVGGGNFIVSLMLLVGLKNVHGTELMLRNSAVAVMMTAGVLAYSMLWARNTTINRRSLIAQTYQIFILSWPCQLVVEVVTERLMHLPWWVVMPSVFVTGVCGPLVLIRLVGWFETKTNTKVLSFVLGR